MEEPTLRYKVGDLVKCIYDLFEHYEFFFDQNPESGYPFYGIIMSVQENVLTKIDMAMIVYIWYVVLMGI